MIIRLYGYKMLSKERRDENLLRLSADFSPKNKQLFLFRRKKDWQAFSALFYQMKHIGLEKDKGGLITEIKRPFFFASFLFISLLCLFVQSLGEFLYI